MLCVVLLGVYALVSLLIAVLIQIAWFAGLKSVRQASRDLLAQRLLPSVGALLVTLGIVMPTFSIYEPVRQMEEIRTLLVVLALLALATAGDGIRRGWSRLWCRRPHVRSLHTPVRPPVATAVHSAVGNSLVLQANRDNCRRV
jgi:hypothetical protein